VVFLVALSAFPVAAGGASTRILITLRRGKALAVIAGTAAVVNIGLNILFVPVLGIAGAALATFLSFGLLAFLQLLTLPETPAWRRPPAALVFSIFAAVGVSAASVWLPQTPTWNIIRFGLALLCLPWLLVQLRNARRGPEIEAIQMAGGRHRRPRRTLNQLVRVLGGSLQSTKERS
jgi:O-antigen/teichoic acid export membrane protein